MKKTVYYSGNVSEMEKKTKAWVKNILLKTISAITKCMISSRGRVLSFSPVGQGALKLSKTTELGFLM